MGDPAGIGPEIIVKAFQDEALPLQSRALVIGDAYLLQETAKKYAPEILIHPIKKPEEGWYQTSTIDVIDLKNVPKNFPLGKPSADAGQASYAAIKAALGAHIDCGYNSSASLNFFAAKITSPLSNSFNPSLYVFIICDSKLSSSMIDTFSFSFVQEMTKNIKNIIRYRE